MATTKNSVVIEQCPSNDESPRVTKSRGWENSILSKLCNDRERLVVLKIDFLLLTWAFVSGLTKDMDQSATTQAYVSGMKESLSLYGNELVEFTTFFSIGYAIAIVPSQLTQTKIRPSVWLPTCEIIWGALNLATFAAKNARTVYALRFFLGVFESTSWPGLASLLFNWYTPQELGTRLAIFGVSGTAGNMFLGILQAALYKNLDGAGGLQGWQWLFIVTGCITMAWGMLGLFIIPDSPSITRALWLTKQERIIAVDRMASHGIKTNELVNRKVVLEKIRALLKTPLSWLYIAAYLQYAWSQRCNSYFLLYLKGLKNDNGEQLYSTYTVNLIPLGGYAISIVTNVGFNYLSDKKQWRWQVAVSTALLQVLCCSVLSAWPDSTPTVMAFYFMTFATSGWGYALLAWIGEILRKEPEVRSILVALTVTLVYVGHATIPLRIWRTSDSPRYPIGFPLSAAWAAGSIVSMLGIEFYIRRHQEILENGLSGVPLEEDQRSARDILKDT
ncbi:major facilitator superfamily domain-containing protein [Aspergillus pseudonomiae]|uniref:Major facilitator superfamily domain-containing protein n=1 Tax=Aspergillus pseudonomiae TaxID=1506151 RepID=A0A5N6I9F0_9EURO|nr:major facilitator superfamily domain-containing protein [Aspergillus pseudonomiae]KAB8263295.1 major facilitator superfamily domain-containing protein [Aspergillus pseudonomiae]KAE8409835.1 major facilitator superfamily domain-containing protein [Aspergillus pseudonomiae]